MSPTPSFPKIVQVKFTGAATNDPVSVTNTRTDERLTRDVKTGDILRLEAKYKSIIFQIDNFVNGWRVGDVISFSIGGTKGATSNVTLTASTNAPQTSTVTATTISTAVMAI